MKRVFVSYSRKDLHRMEEVTELLDTLGLEIWTDRDLPRGSPAWSYAIEREIRAAHAVLVLMSPGARESRWIEREITFAERLGATICPVLLSGSPAEAIPIYLAERDYVDARDGLAPVSHLAEELLGPGRRRTRARRADVDPVAPLLGEPERIPGAEWVEPSSGIAFVWVPPGSFEMGDDTMPEASPAHAVRLSSGTWFGRHPVTNREWDRFVEATGGVRTPRTGTARFGHPLQPVVAVTWHDARDFCKWLTSHLPQGWEANLPTEAQWEWAARGSDRRPFPWGEASPTPERADFDQDPTCGGPDKVDRRPGGAGPFGAEEQAGTVWEWCQDRWVESYDAVLDRRVDPCHQPPGSAARNIEVPRVVRGGCWASLAEGLRCSVRLKFPPSEADELLGLRVVVCRRSPAGSGASRSAAKNFESTLVNNSRASTLWEAISEWELRFKGHTETPMSCHVCGQRLKHHAYIVNERTGARLVLGLTCHARLRESLHAAQVVTPLLSDAWYRRRRRERTVQGALRELRAASDWEVPDLDHGSWKRWFMDQERRGRLPEELAGGMERLRRDGFLGSDEEVDRFLAFHNAHRRFPSQLLLPHTRLRALYRDPHRVPPTLTIDAAVRLARWGKSRAELGRHVLDRLCEMFDVLNRPDEYRLLVAYNFLLVFQRAYAGLANDRQREEFVRHDLLLRMDPAVSGLPLGPGSKPKLDAEVGALTRLLAELLAPLFREAVSHTPQLEAFATRIEDVARSGEVPIVWPLAPTPEMLGAAGAPRPEVLAEAFSSVHGHRGLAGLLDTELTVQARTAWQRTARTPPANVIIAAGWLAAPFCCSSVGMVIERQGTFLAIGLNHRWRAADTTERHAILDLILGDLLGRRADPDSLYRAHRFLSAVEMRSLRRRDPERASELLRRLRIDVQPSVQDHPPNLVTNRSVRTVHYDRWSHTVFLPGSLTRDTEDEVLTIPSSLAGLATLDPPPVGHPRQTRSRSAPNGFWNWWYQLDWAWIQPERGELDAYFFRRHHVGFPPRAVEVSRELTDLLNRLLGGHWRVQR